MTTDDANETEEYTILSTQRVDGGMYHRIRHPSPSAGGLSMTFGLFVPSRHAGNVGGKETEKEKEGGEKKEGGKKRTDNVPAMFWLSGLTCDGEFCRPPTTTGRPGRARSRPYIPFSFSPPISFFCFFPSASVGSFVFVVRPNSSPPFFFRDGPSLVSSNSVRPSIHRRSVAIYPFFPRENKTPRAGWMMNK
jgi:hypothetical protein